MARSKPTARTDYVFFDVFYEDGSRASNRKIAASHIGGLEGDDPARGFFEAQDKDIEHRSGRSKPRILRIERSKA